jgi:hypothetical protein
VAESLLSTKFSQKIKINIFSARARTTLTPALELLCILSPWKGLGLQFAEIILLELGQVGLTANPTLLNDICRLMQSHNISRAAPDSVVFSSMESKKTYRTDSV